MRLEWLTPSEIRTISKKGKNAYRRLGDVTLTTSRVTSTAAVVTRETIEDSERKMQIE